MPDLQLSRRRFLEARGVHAERCSTAIIRIEDRLPITHLIIGDCRMARLKAAFLAALAFRHSIPIDVCLVSAPGVKPMEMADA